MIMMITKAGWIEKNIPKILAVLENVLPLQPHLEKCD